MAGYLYLLAVAAGIVFVVWSFRKKAAEREAASKKRFGQIFGGKAPAPPPTEPPATAVPVAGVNAEREAPAAVTAVSPRERFLGQAETLVYLLLKAGLPDHGIFANVALASVISARGTGYEHEQQSRRLAQYQLDFVVCDRNMRVVAAVEVEATSNPDAAGARRFKNDCLKAAGIRLVRINPAAPPRRDEIRALIDGGPATPQHGSTAGYGRVTH